MHKRKASKLQERKIRGIILRESFHYRLSGETVCKIARSEIMGARRFDWADALADAAIISALAFFSTLGGGSVAGLESLSALKAASVAACAQFFVFLAIKRGIVQKEGQNQ